MDKHKALLKIAREVESCPLCKRWGDGRAVPGEGNPDAGIVFIGEAPGRKRQRQDGPSSEDRGSC